MAMVQIPFYLSLYFLWLSTAPEKPFIKTPPGGEGKTTIEAAVVGVTINGKENEYTFNVALKSDDTGCGQYADWWEIISPDGRLVYRRILGHSHVEEQPFTRSGGPVAVTPGQTLYIRGHMNKVGYGRKVYLGTVAGGFTPATLATDFAENLEEIEPLPSGCAF
jgi:hypothetical protein